MSSWKITSSNWWRRYAKRPSEWTKVQQAEKEVARTVLKHIGHKMQSFTFIGLVDGGIRSVGDPAVHLMLH